jgi:chemotaxis signal transduction protein
MKYYLKYTISGVQLATPIEEVKEVARPKTVMRGKRSKHLIGFINVRKKKIPFYDLPTLLGIEAGDTFEAIVSHMNKAVIGFKVNKVIGIITAEDLFPFPELVHAKNYFSGIIREDDSVIQVLSLKKLVSRFRLSSRKK